MMKKPSASSHHTTFGVSAFRRFGVCLRSFTLIELLVVMGIIAVLGGLTALGYRSVAKDSKLSSGKNTVMAVLDTARGLAMKHNQTVAVVFRPRLKTEHEQYIEAVICQYTGDVGIACYDCAVVGAQCSSPTCVKSVERFAPMPNVSPRALPLGLMIAGPAYAEGLDSTWFVPSHLPLVAPDGTGEAADGMLAVMYDSTGATISRNSDTDSHRFFVDFNNDLLQQFEDAAGNDVYYDYFYNSPPPDSPVAVTAAEFDGLFFEQRAEEDEPYVTVVPFLSVFDDDEVREVYDMDQWDFSVNPGAFDQRRADYSTYITNNADRIHFNRYTGVAMK